MKVEKELHAKDEEKDINLLLSRIKQNPKNFGDRVDQKIIEFKELFDTVKSTPTEKNEDFYSLCLFVGELYEYYPKKMESLIEAMI